MSGQSADAIRNSAELLEKDARELSGQWSKATLQSAAKQFRAASVLWKNLNDTERASYALLQSGRLRLQAGENLDAIRELLVSLEQSGPNILSVQTSRALCNLSLAYLKIGETDEAKKYLDRALKTSQELGDKQTLGFANYAAGEYYYWQNLNDRALDHYARSEILLREVGDTRLLIDTLISTAYIHMTLGNASVGLRYGRDAEELAIAGNYHRSIVLSRIACGHLASFMNEKQLALDYYSKAIQSFPDDIDFNEKGALLNGLGAIYEHYEDLQTSLNYRLKALDNFDRDGFKFGYLSTLHSIIGICFQLEKIADANKYISQADQLSRQLNDRYYASLVSRTIADHHFSNDEFDRAIHFYQRSLDATQSIGYRTNSVVINNKLGQIYYRKKDATRARQHFEKALSDSLEIKNFFAAAESYFHLAILQEPIDRTEAIRLARQSIEATEMLYSDVGNSNLKRSFFSSVSARYELYTKLLMSSYKDSPNRDTAFDAIRNIEQSRGRALKETLMMSESKFLADGDPVLIEKENALQFQLTAKLDKLASTLEKENSASDSDQIQNEILDIQHRLGEIRAEIKLSSPLYSAIKNPEPFNVADFQSNVLDGDSVLLQFSLGEGESYLWAVDNADVSAYYLPSRDVIEARIERLRGLLNSRQLNDGESLGEYQARTADAETEYKAEARILSRELFGEVWDKLDGKKLIFVADGRLHYFPIGALPLPGSDGDEPIVLANEVVYSPSASALKLLRMERKYASKPTKDIVVFADPVFSKTDERIAGLEDRNGNFLASIVATFRSIESYESMPRLPASEQEAISISDVVGAHRTTVRSGFEANRDGVLNGDVEKYNVIHFATHGRIDEKRPELSGIVLSLYNPEGKRPDGGFIRLQDVHGLKLNSDLVVLSACETGIGKEVKGEGVMSLNNAFLQAGARSVVSSLWKVDDAATKDLMTEFYRGMADESLTAAAALRRAQIKMFNDPRYKSPFFWAAFTASGDHVSTISFTSASYKYPAIFAGFIVLALGILAVKLSRRRRILPIR